MAFRPFVEFQNPIDHVEDDLLFILQRNIDNVLDQSPVIIGEKRNRNELSSSPLLSDDIPTKVSSITSNYDECRYKYKIELLSTELEEVRAELQKYKQKTNSNKTIDIPKSLPDDNIDKDLMLENLKLKQRIKELQVENKQLNEEKTKFGSPIELLDKINILEEKLLSLKHKKHNKIKDNNNISQIEVSNIQNNQNIAKNNEIKDKYIHDNNIKELEQLSLLQNQIEYQKIHCETLENKVKSQQLLELEITDLKQQLKQKDNIITNQDKKIVNLTFVKDKMDNWNKILGKGIFENVEDINTLENVFTNQINEIKTLNLLINEGNKNIQLYEKQLDEYRNKEKELKQINFNQTKELQLLQTQIDIMNIDINDLKELNKTLQKTSEIQQIQIEDTTLDDMNVYFTFDEFQQFCEQIFGWNVILKENYDEYKIYEIGLPVGHIEITYQEGQIENIVCKGKLIENHKRFITDAENKDCPNILRLLHGVYKKSQQRQITNTTKN